MINSFDDLFLARGADGAFAPVGVVNHDAVELDQIMNAWFQEREISIESSLYLKRAAMLFSQILGQEDLSPRTRRKIRNLMLAMKQRDR